MKRINVIQIGIGTVGGAVIEQLVENLAFWQSSLGLDVAIGAVITRDGALVASDANGIDATALLGIAAGRRAGSSLRDLAGALVSPDEAIRSLADSGALVAMDAAAGDHATTIDAAVIKAGGGVVLSNKAPMSMPHGTVGDVLWDNAGPFGRVRYEATCGAGLPVFSSLRALLDTGDTIKEISGTVSGTMGAIFSDVAAGAAFSAAVRSAKDRGYTEPDPRDDLSGLDVARKALILARTLGRRLDLTDIAVESLVPDSLKDGSVEEFLSHVSMLDEPIGTRSAAARASGQTLKYIATVRPEGGISVGIAEVSTSTVLGALQGPENIVSFRTARYDQYPLVVSGPGAGAAVTAAGMIGDMLSLSLVL